MKILKVSVLLALSARSLWSVDLQSATNHQLLGEVSRRMGGENVESAALATYLCENGYLKLSLLGETLSGTLTFYLGNNGKCLDQATPLSKFKSRINTLTIAAICENGYLKRLALYKSGQLKEVDTTYLGNQEQCMVQAKQVNEF